VVSGSLRRRIFVPEMLPPIQIVKRSQFTTNAHPTIKLANHFPIKKKIGARTNSFRNRRCRKGVKSLSKWQQQTTPILIPPLYVVIEMADSESKTDWLLIAHPCQPKLPSKTIRKTRLTLHDHLIYANVMYVMIILFSSKARILQIVIAK
jgi:hypothetical protein